MMYRQVRRAAGEQGWGRGEELGLHRGWSLLGQRTWLLPLMCGLVALQSRALAEPRQRKHPGCLAGGAKLSGLLRNQGLWRAYSFSGARDASVWLHFLPVLGKSEAMRSWREWVPVRRFTWGHAEARKLQEISVTSYNQWLCSLQPRTVCMCTNMCV